MRVAFWRLLSLSIQTPRLRLIVIRVTETHQDLSSSHFHMWACLPVYWLHCSPEIRLPVLWIHVCRPYVKTKAFFFFLGALKGKQLYQNVCMKPPRWIKAALAPQFGRGLADPLGGCCSIYDLLTLGLTSSPSSALTSWLICPFQPHHADTRTPHLNTWLDCWKAPSVGRGPLGLKQALLIIDKEGIYWCV